LASDSDLWREGEIGASDTFLSLQFAGVSGDGARSFVSSQFAGVSGEGGENGGGEVGGGEEQGGEGGNVGEGVSAEVSVLSSNSSGPLSLSLSSSLKEKNDDTDVADISNDSTSVSTPILSIFSKQSATIVFSSSVSGRPRHDSDSSSFRTCKYTKDPRLRTASLTRMRSFDSLSSLELVTISATLLAGLSIF
jgi:hypothetical protein